jgi:DNA repair protein RecO (recombination protein O)
MEWESQGIILANKDFIENKVIVTIFTSEFGIKKGLCRKKSSIESGNLVHCFWKARLENHLGYLKVEIVETISSFLFFNPEKLKILNSLISILIKILPEGYKKIEIYEHFITLLRLLKTSDEYYKQFIEFDLLLLENLGFKLDLSKCAVTKKRQDLYYISPKTGRAVSNAAGNQYHDKLILLPKVLYDLSNNLHINNENKSMQKEDFIKCVKITNYFIKKFLFDSFNIKFPYHREILVK